MKGFYDIAFVLTFLVILALAVAGVALHKIDVQHARLGKPAFTCPSECPWVEVVVTTDEKGNAVRWCRCE